MASVNDLILESNVRERLYPAMPFKILQIYMKTANRYAYASCFSAEMKKFLTERGLEIGEAN